MKERKIVMESQQRETDRELTVEQERRQYEDGKNKKKKASDQK